MILKSNLPDPHTFTRSPNRYSLQEQGLNAEDKKYVMNLYNWYRDGDEMPALFSVMNRLTH